MTVITLRRQEPKLGCRKRARGQGETVTQKIAQQPFGFARATSINSIASVQELGREGRHECGKLYWLSFENQKTADMNIEQCSQTLFDIRITWTRGKNAKTQALC